MIPYYGTHSTGQQTTEKLIQVPCKIGVLAEAYGYVVQYEPYQCAKKGKEVAFLTKSRL